MFSRRQVAELARHENEFAEGDARLIVIGNGEPDQIQPFRQVTGYRGEIYTDPTRETYRTLHLRSGVGSLFGMKSIREGIRAFRNGHTQQVVQGSALQQGGALAAGPGDRVHYFYQSREPGDFPPIDELIGACKS